MRHDFRCALVCQATLLAVSCGAPTEERPRSDGTPVDGLVLSLDSATLVIGTTLQLSASAFDADGNALGSVPVAWQTSDTNAVSVSGGAVTAAGVGSARMIASAECRVDTATIRVTVRLAQLTAGQGFSCAISTKGTGGLFFQSLSAGTAHTCGVALGGLAYCWGDNVFGQRAGPPTVGA